ncbi:MAG: GAF domain-containing protein [Gammaproteobacteria bacterium]
MPSKSLALWQDSTADDIEPWLLEGLKAGCEYFEMKTGIISKVVDNRYIIRAVYSTMGDIFSPGMEFELQNTYCEAVIQKKDFISYLQVGKIPTMVLHPVYVAVQLESYMGVPLYNNKQIDGTLNFSSFQVREQAFSSDEIALIKSMGEKIESVIYPEQNADTSSTN